MCCDNDLGANGGWWWREMGLSLRFIIHNICPMDSKNIQRASTASDDLRSRIEKIGCVGVCLCIYIAVVCCDQATTRTNDAIQFNSTVIGIAYTHSLPLRARAMPNRTNCTTTNIHKTHQPQQQRTHTHNPRFFFVFKKSRSRARAQRAYSRTPSCRAFAFSLFVSG